MNRPHRPKKAQPTAQGDSKRLGDVLAMLRMADNLQTQFAESEKNCPCAKEAVTNAPARNCPARQGQCRDSASPPPERRVCRDEARLDAASQKLCEQRQLVANMCKMLGAQAGKPSPAANVVRIDPSLPPRLRQTLEHLIAGCSEKEVAAKLGISRHTVHVYVKSLYRHYNVSSRAELLARFVPQAGK